jgi:hypothetical protein
VRRIRSLSGNTCACRYENRFMSKAFPHPGGPLWHAGERETQRRAGVAERMERFVRF